MKITLRILLLFMIVSGFIFSGNAYALRITVNAWIAHHHSYGIPTDEYFLVIEKPDLQKAYLSGFTFKPEAEMPDFSDLTSEAVSFWQIDEKNSRQLLGLSRIYSQRYDILMKIGRLEESTEKQVWVNDMVSEMLSKRKYFARFRDQNGRWMTALAVFKPFENPPEHGEPNNGASPVPEPATMLLLGSGMIGLAAAGRKKLFNR